MCFSFRRKEKGGVNFTSSLPQAHIDADMVATIAREYRTPNCDVVLRQANVTVDQLIDVIEGNRVYMPTVYVLNKIDAISIEELDLVRCVSVHDWLPVLPVHLMCAPCPIPPPPPPHLLAGQSAALRAHLSQGRMEL